MLGTGRSGGRHIEAVMAMINRVLLSSLLFRLERKTFGSVRLGDVS